MSALSTAATVVDTTVLVDHLRGVVDARNYLLSLNAPPFASELSRAEVISGLRTDERRAAEQLFGGIEWVPVGERIAREAGTLGRRFRRSHVGLGVADLVIAATALLLGADLATHNVKHYPMFPGLSAPY
jgi:predicted nucleic acid-binding protein